MRKVTHDQMPMALLTANDKWIVLFVLNSVEFSSAEINTLEEAKVILQRVEERVKEWAGGGEVWVED
jgi:hypothetical protein